jgi:head-tail joining protein
VSLQQLLTDSVVRRRAPLTSAGYGNQARDWTAATSQTYVARVSPVSSTEDVVEQPRTVTRWKCTVDATADLVSTDRIEWDGATYEIDGDVEVHKGLRGVHHQSMVLMRVATRV